MNDQNNHDDNDKQDDNSKSETQAQPKPSPFQPNRLNRDEERKKLMTLIKEVSARLGYVPSFKEFRQQTGVTLRRVHRSFVSYANALKVCELERQGKGIAIGRHRVFLEWARVVRQMGAIPMMSEFLQHSTISENTIRRCFGKWAGMPKGMLSYAAEHKLEGEWKDVIEIARQHCMAQAEKEPSSKPSSIPPLKTRIREDRQLYGAPLMRLPLANAPSNEQGVVLLFGALAVKLGFSILCTRTVYPDAEALREVEPGRWQLVKIEFEFVSRNFVRHMHDPLLCDLIVCWEHDWAECPLEVVELKAVVGMLFERSGDPVIG